MEVRQWHVFGPEMWTQTPWTVGYTEEDEIGHFHSEDDARAVCAALNERDLSCTRDETCGTCAKYTAGFLENELREIGNLIGGPTMTYSGIHEIREWRARAQKIAAIVASALVVSSPPKAKNTQLSKPD